MVYRGFVHKRNLLALIDDMKNIVNTSITMSKRKETERKDISKGENKGIQL